MSKKAFSRAVIRRSLSLLNMQYKASEIAFELGIDSRTIYGAWVEAGIPHKKIDGHLFFNGLDVRAWLSENGFGGKAVTLEDNQAFCVGCRGPVSFTLKKRESMANGRVLLRGVCDAGHKVSRITKADKND